jgi:zinc and cadmium transporter
MIASYFILFFCALAGGILALIASERVSKWLPYLLSFSGAFLFGIMVLDLFPAIFRALPQAGYWLLSGFFLQIMLEQISLGAEHGHIHAEQKNKVHGFSVLLALSLHAWLEGMPLVSGELSSDWLKQLVAGISVHKIPEAFAVASILLASGIKRTAFYLLIVFFSAITPLASFMSGLLHVADSNFLLPLLALATGSFLHVATTILFESEHKVHHLRWRKVAAVIAGCAVALLIQ